MAIIALLVTGSVLYGTWWLINFPHRFKWLKPLHIALCGPLGIPEDTKPHTYLRIRPGYYKREKVGKVILPKTFTGLDQATPTAIIKNKLALTDVSVTYNLAGRNPHLTIKQTPRPPARALFAEHETSVIIAKESAPLIGIGPKNKLVCIDLDTESPHILVSASTGGGKSVILRTMAAQMLHNGAQMSVLDFKRHSHRWARGLPQVNYCREIEEIHDELIRLGAEGHRRNYIVDTQEDPQVGPRTVIILEEVNATIGKLKRFWAAVRTKDDPKESPALDALREILFMGRAVQMHVLAVAQSATVHALGGPEMRECFATRILARYTVNAWKMLVPEVHPVPRSTRHIGRAQVVLGGYAIETQVLFFSDAEAREWASTGIVAPPPEVSRHASHNALTWENEADTSCDVTRKLTLVKPLAERMSLAEAARREIIPMRADALRQAKRRDPEFPQGVDGKYTAEELVRWYRNRPVKTA